LDGSRKTYLVGVWLVHANHTVLIRHITDYLPIHLPVLVGKRPPLCLRMSVGKLLGAWAEKQVHDRVEGCCEVKAVAVLFKLLSDVVGHSARDEA
jgi:hypothetical protein